MTKSDNILNLSKALLQFHLKVGKIKKDASNPFLKSKYASLSNILDAIETPLSESKLAFTQFPSGDNGLVTILIHTESGEFMQCEYNMKPVKDDPQGRGSVITYQRRYALASVLGLNIDEDDDANTATFGGKTPEKAEENKPWLNKANKDGSLTDNWQKVIEALKGGGYTLAQVEGKYKISKENKAELLTIKSN